ncbi:N5-carboxyaminoimidazole ribonucleotide synthase [Zhongshania aliphaticivorans]|uniref:N5-carboxyaminoimidazole ribonucleotide synthase n=1 Tax=Zhongshania aliphaticivorans TaxID=1470434 RepID=A0A5S9N743_9GAMM|nr:5-(carboxyamino)imidazole ribonucleotide synthase [Zhongshania aliphaticivorans]CAA0080390.1 N5-carboxyaminoimidazole ribonucleotide synthase [Zhongshania aliphaticivorans]CAA0085749.1 N5-carboxyaminoimidazole ribonucleotide synthase [Zhongshania aliphaticivorans]
MPTVWVLGAGQLGAMLKQAAYPLALDVVPIEPDSEHLPDIADHDIVTVEREQWPDTAVTRHLSSQVGFMNADIFGKIADRFHQKTMLDTLGINTAPWRSVELDTKAEALHAELGPDVLLKRREGGYDGKGQYWLYEDQGDEVPSDWQGTGIAEKKIPFNEELSLVGARDKDGNKVFYPLTLNLHSNGILMASVAPLARVAHLQPMAESMLSKIMDSANYIGVMAMECFRVGEQLIVNELAPRVHNSGHWTQAGACVSQFEMHLRAVSGLPIKAPEVRGQSVMINLIGVERELSWMEVPSSQSYWYGKDVRPGRKLGHININHPQKKAVQLALSTLRKQLPDNYNDVFDWVDKELKRI